LARLHSIFLAFLIVSCSARNSISAETANINDVNMENTDKSGIIAHNEPAPPDYSLYLAALSNSRLPTDIISNIEKLLFPDSGFIAALEMILDKDKETYDPYLFFLVDKERALGEDYTPDDLIQLRNGSYRVSRNDLFLRSKAVISLEEMAAAARAEGLTLLASSAYRSYSYQVEVYSRWVRQLGQAAADRVSARPGHSQHQLGTTIDFGSISNEFADTREGIWLTANASRFGWSLSYPREYERITGYSWESWHFRYVGKDIAAFIENYFDGIQQYAFKFIYEFTQQDFR